MKKILLSFLASLVFLFSFAPFLVVKAQGTQPPRGTWYNPSFGQWYDKVYNETTSPANEIFGERYTAAQVQWVIWSLFAFVINIPFGAPTQNIVGCLLNNVGDLTTCFELLKEASIPDTSSPVVQSNPQAPEKSLSQLVFSNKPFSGLGYIQERYNKFKIVPDANAQTVGFGFNALKPVQDMWRASRNIAFGLFVLATIIFAFMIMFRVKISPQVVISVQTAIPQLIIALILVTFSYAIAGFLVDLMYVIYGVLSLLLKGFLPIGNATASGVFQFLTAGKLGFSGVGIETGVLGLITLYLTSFSLSFGLVLFATTGFLVSAMAGVVTILLLASPLQSLLTLIAGFTFLIIVAMLIWNTIKIVWSLLKAFVNILLLTIFAPLQIAIGVLIPSFGFSAWIKSFASNLAVFVMTSVLIFFAFIFMLYGLKTGLDAIAGPGTPFVDFVFKLLLGSNLATSSVALRNPNNWPPLIGPSGFFGGAQGIMGLLYLGVSFVMFTLIPKANEIIQGFISGRPFAYGSAVGEALGPARWLGGQAYRYSGIPNMAEAIELSRTAGLVNTYAGSQTQLMYRLLNAITRGAWPQTVTNIRRKGGLIDAD
jgi:hypothetical protein